MFLILVASIVGLILLTRITNSIDKINNCNKCKTNKEIVTVEKPYYFSPWYIPTQIDPYKKIWDVRGHPFYPRLNAVGFRFGN